jgi:protein-disulfide isomerase
MIHRRSFLALAATGLAVAPFAAQAQLAADDPRMAERAAGRPDAPVTVIEYFSLTCGHCAAFHRDIWPRVNKELVEAGRMRMVFRDFPLDQLALAAAGLARSLPAERYEPFLGALMATQDRWAFNRNADRKEELWKLSAMAGMTRETFEAALVDANLQRAILEQRVKGQQEHNVTSTPTFVFGSRVVPGNMTFDTFARHVAEAR